MDICKFAEEICGIDLNEQQKELFRLYSLLPYGSVVVMGKSGPIILSNDGCEIGKLNNRGVAKALLDGCRPNFTYVDEIHDEVKE